MQKKTWLVKIILESLALAAAIYAICFFSEAAAENPSYNADMLPTSGVCRAIAPPKIEAPLKIGENSRCIVEVKGEIGKKYAEVQGEITERKQISADLSKIEQNVPNWKSGCHSSTKTHMGYTAITAKNSPQFKLQQIAHTDQSGIRMVDDRYMIAVGTYYAEFAGQHLNVVMKSGKQIRCIVGDFKADSHTDDMHMYHVGGYENGVHYAGDGSVIEFIVDSSVYSTKTIPAEFDGEIYAILKE